MTTQYRYDPDGIGAMPSARSGVLRTEPCSTVSALRAPAAIAKTPPMKLPLRRTAKADGDHVIINPHLKAWLERAA